MLLYQSAWENWGEHQDHVIDQTTDNKITDAIGMLNQNTNDFYQTNFYVDAKKPDKASIQKYNYK